MRAPIGIHRKPRRRRHERPAECGPQNVGGKNIGQRAIEPRHGLPVALRLFVLPARHIAPRPLRSGGMLPYGALRFRHRPPVLRSARGAPGGEIQMRKWLGALVLLPGLCGAAAAQAPAYPQRPITLIVTAAAGGVTDVVARALGQGMTKDWGQAVGGGNRGGAAHILGAGGAARAGPDGYTLMGGGAATFTINPVIYPKGKLPYDTDPAFAPISGLVRINQALLADTKLPVNNAGEMTA